MWTETIRDKKPVLRHRAALICAIIAYVGLLAPRSHAAARLPEKTSTNHSLQYENVRILLETFYLSGEGENTDICQYVGQPIRGLPREGESERSLRQLEAETLFCYYTASADLRKRSVYTVSRAIRLAKSINLFEEAKWKGSKDEDNLRRGIAWDLIVVDR